MTDAPLHERAGVHPVLVGKSRRPHYSNSAITLCDRPVNQRITPEEAAEYGAYCIPCVRVAERMAEANALAAASPLAAAALQAGETIAAAAPEEPQERAPFTAGDRIMCVDGVVRTVRDTVRRAGAWWVATREGPSWPAGHCERVDTSGVPAAWEAANRAAARVRANPDPGDPQWRAALDELVDALRYLRHADPVYADVVRDIAGERLTIPVPHTDVLAGDILHLSGARLEVRRTGIEYRPAPANPRWWAELYGVTEEDRRATYPFPWRFAVEVGREDTDVVTVERLVPNPHATLIADYQPGLRLDPADEGFCQDRLVISTCDHVGVAQYRVPHEPGRTGDDMLRVYGWRAVKEWTPLPDGACRTRVLRAEPEPAQGEDGPVTRGRATMRVRRVEVGRGDILHDRGARLMVLDALVDRDTPGGPLWQADLLGVNEEDRQRTHPVMWTLSVRLEDAEQDEVTVERFRR
ncbi:MAG TPA: hypothetical protein VK545_08175 [Streptomyces sp.]|nr:hypothetical protein [Streptomyces sp.]